MIKMESETAISQRNIQSMHDKLGTIVVPDSDDNDDVETGRLDVRNAENAASTIVGCETNPLAVPGCSHSGASVEELEISDTDNTENDTEDITLIDESFSGSMTYILNKEVRLIEFALYTL